MKKIKVVSIFLLTFAMFSLTSCDNEPLEGEFSDGTENGGGNGNGSGASNCIEATNNVAEATNAFGQVTVNDANYSTVCNDYLNALQDFVNLCGDSSGTIQALIDSLDCTGNVQNDCDSAQAVTQSAADAYNANTSNATLCNAYVTALQNEISICGDPNGDLQAIINGLDCNTSSNDLLPRQIIHTYPDGSTITEDYTFNGTRLTREEITYNFVGEPNETDVYEYTYSNDLLVRIDIATTDGLGNPETYHTILEYDSSNQLISETHYFPGNTQIDTYTHNSDGTVTFTEGGEETYIYTIVNGNLMSKEHTNGPHDYTYTYDDKNGFAKNVFGIGVFGINSFGINNNLLNAINTGGASFPDNESNTYTYNSDDYPLTSTTVENEGTAEENTFTTEYYYY